MPPKHGEELKSQLEILFAQRRASKARCLAGIMIVGCE